MLTTRAHPGGLQGGRGERMYSQRAGRKSSSREGRRWGRRERSGRDAGRSPARHWYRCDPFGSSVISYVSTTVNPEGFLPYLGDNIKPDRFMRIAGYPRSSSDL